MLIAYRILTYLLLPVAALLALLTLIALSTAAANAAFLLPAFLFGATTIYVFTSLVFLHQGILGGKALKASLYDWIRVNSFVALFVGIVFVVQTLYFRGNHELTGQLQSQVDAMAKNYPQSEVPDIRKLVNGVLVFMFATGTVLLTHIMLGYRLLQQYRASFSR